MFNKIITLCSVTFLLYRCALLSAPDVGLPNDLSPQSVLTQEQFLKFCREHPEVIYQDIFIGGEVCFQGVNDCGIRFPILKQVLDRFENKSFSVLDVGGAQGYFSHRIAYEFPRSEVTIIEHKNKNYDLHGKMLYHLCHLNGLKNVSYLHYELTVSSLQQLNQMKEHFNVVLLLLVVHQINDSMVVRKSFIHEALQLGDFIILEVSNDWAPELRDYVRDELCKSEQYDCTFLGEVLRYHDPLKTSGPYPAGGKGEFYLIHKKGLVVGELAKEPTKKISREAYQRLNGIFPD